MTRLIISRLLSMIPIWLLISVASFVLIHLSPASPAALLLGDTNVPQKDIDRLTHQMGLDKPLPVQYGIWVSHVLKGDWGYSYFQHAPVLSVLAQHAEITFGITLVGLFFALLLGISAGVIGAAKRGTAVDLLTAVISTLGLSVPEFWLAMILILIFAVHFHLFPATGFVSFTRSPLGWFEHILLPGFTVGFVQSAVIARIVRSSVLDTLQQPYIQTARAKGLPGSAILLKHALRSSLLPVLTVIGIVVMLLVAGSFVVEVVFTIPGLGELLLNATLNHDYPVVQGGILFLGTAIMLINLLVDLGYTFADPRVRDV